jgi:hypothetical protein
MIDAYYRQNGGRVLVHAAGSYDHSGCLSTREQIHALFLGGEKFNDLELTFWWNSLNFCLSSYLLIYGITFVILWKVFAWDDECVLTGIYHPYRWPSNLFCREWYISHCKWTSSRNTFWSKVANLRTVSLMDCWNKNWMLTKRVISLRVAINQLTFHYFAQCFALILAMLASVKLWSIALVSDNIMGMLLFLIQE